MTAVRRNSKRKASVGTQLEIKKAKVTYESDVEDNDENMELQAQPSSARASKARGRAKAKALKIDSGDEAVGVPTKEQGEKEGEEAAMTGTAQSVTSRIPRTSGKSKGQTSKGNSNGGALEDIPKNVEGSEGTEMVIAQPTNANRSKSRGRRSGAAPSSSNKQESQQSKEISKNEKEEGRPKIIVAQEEQQYMVRKPRGRPPKEVMTSSSNDIVQEKPQGIKENENAAQPVKAELPAQLLVPTALNFALPQGMRTGNPEQFMAAIHQKYCHNPQIQVALARPEPLSQAEVEIECIEISDDEADVFARPENRDQGQQINEVDELPVPPHEEQAVQQQQQHHQQQQEDDDVIILNEEVPVNVVNGNNGQAEGNEAFVEVANEEQPSDNTLAMEFKNPELENIRRQMEESFDKKLRQILEETTKNLKEELLRHNKQVEDLMESQDAIGNQVADLEYKLKEYSEEISEGLRKFQESQEELCRDLEGVREELSELSKCISSVSDTVADKMHKMAKSLEKTEDKLMKMKPKFREELDKFAKSMSRLANYEIKKMEGANGKGE